MPSLYNLNSQSHPFWDFVASLDDTATRNQRPNSTESHQASARANNADTPGRKSTAKQPTVEDEVAAESSSQEKGKAAEPAARATGEPQQVPFRGRGRCGGNDSAPQGRPGCRSGPCGGRRGARAGVGESHATGEGFDGFGDFNPFGMRGPPFGGFGMFGPPPPGPPGSHPHHGPPHPGHPPHHHPEHRRGLRGGPENFNLGEFLSNLGSRIGIDLSGAAEGLGLDRFAGASNAAEGIDFEPRADIFDTPTNYLVHLSLPGAKKDDLGVDWDGENSTLRIGGVVHRPGVDEATLKLLAVDGRRREVGVFEKKIHLGTKRDPAKIDIAGISAKMTDGVLVVKVPKVEVQHEKREVPISGSTTPSPVREGKQELQQQPAVAHSLNDASSPATITAMDIDTVRPAETEKADDMEYDDPAKQLPEYKEPAQDDAAATGSQEDEDEGDYVKIDVK